MGKAWTAEATLPGGDLPDADFPAFLRALRADYPWLPPDLAEHYAHLYGTRARQLLGDARGMADLGRHHGALLYGREVDFLRATEWAVTPADVLTRRTKHGLHMTPTSGATSSAAWRPPDAHRLPDAVPEPVTPQRSRP